MSLIKVKNSLVKKTITNLNADITRKGTWAYQNALALESLMSSDNILNDYVDFGKQFREQIEALKTSVKSNYKFETFTRELPNRFNDANIIRELESGELVSWIKNKNNLQILVSKDNGYSWETLLNRFFNQEDTLYDVSVLDLVKIGEKYFMSFTSSFDGENNLYLSEIVGGEVKAPEVVYSLSAGTSISGIKIVKDKYNRAVVIFGVKNGSYEEAILAVKSSTGMFINTPLNFLKADAIFGQEVYFDKNGVAYIALNNDGKLGIVSVDLSNENAQQLQPHFAISSENEEEIDKTSLTTFVIGTKMICVRVGGKIQSFDLVLKEFGIFSDLILKTTEKSFTFIITKNLEIIFKNKISKDFGKTWEILNISNSPIQETLSNLSKYGSFYKNFIITQNVTDATKTNNKKFISTVEEIKNSEIKI